MKNKEKISAIVLAGGRGQRMNNQYKQFMLVDKRPAIFYSLDILSACSRIGRIVVVVPEEKLDYSKRLLLKYGDKKNIVLVTGGNDRKRSSYNGLLYLKNNKIPCDYVVFHDAARPLIRLEMVEAVVKEAIKNGAAALGHKLIDATSVVENAFIKSFPEQRDMYVNQTPHCFRFGWILEAHEDKRNKKSSGENIGLLLKIGKKVKLTKGFYPNLKMTYLSDLILAESYIKILKQKNGKISRKSQS